MSLLSASNVTQLPTIPTATDLLSHIPDGIYSVAYVAHETHKYFGRSCKVVFWFRIIEFGDYFGTVIPRYYNVKRLSGKPGRNGQFVPGRSSDFLREFCKVSTAPINRLDRLPLSAFQNVQIKARVRTVSADGKQRDLAAQLHYSVIGELLGLDR
jgi:hypothetical protein